MENLKEKKGMVFIYIKKKLVLPQETP